jgi:folate-dependent phosphoribosylglycinamide formyltransferase PurN
MTVVVLGRDGPGTRVIVNSLAQELEIGGVVLERPEPQHVFLKRRVRRLGLARAVGQVFFRALAMPLIAWTSASRITEIRRQYGLNDSAIDSDLITRVESVNDPLTVRVLRHIDPDVVVLSGSRIVSGQTLRSVRATFLNIHSGITPLYRGVHGAYWALVHGDQGNCGVTVHLVDEGIDTGGILQQAPIFPTDRDTFATYPVLQLGVGLPHLMKAIEDVLRGSVEVKDPPSGESKLWTHPTLLEYLRNRRRLGVR